MKNYFIAVIFFILLTITEYSTSYAESDYVLPYPSFMPGSTLYKPRLILDEIMKYWYFGNFSKFQYSLKQSDKYLVEAKTLFEYRQYFLARSALEKSNVYFQQAPIFLQKARKEKKDIAQKKSLLHSASLKHIELLHKLRSEVPETFFWQPEKSESSILELHKEIDSSIVIRQACI